jgi:BirA family biotin operon repressor/biotin-[acetyl-CoA-carboxylase] ligase
LIQDLDRCYGILEGNGFPIIAKRWEGLFRLRGKRVRVDMPEGSVQGKAMGIDTDGALILEGEGGHRERIVAGDVIPIHS